jgi:hypothetical protein
MQCIAVPRPEDKDKPFVRTADLIIDSLEEFSESMLNRLGGKKA